jgi:hypothetical protein
MHYSFKYFFQNINNMFSEVLHVYSTRISDMKGNATHAQAVTLLSTV